MQRAGLFIWERRYRHVLLMSHRCSDQLSVIINVSLRCTQDFGKSKLCAAAQQRHSPWQHFCSKVASNYVFLGVCALMPPPTHWLTNEYEQNVLGGFFSLLLQFHDILSTCMHHRHPQDLPGFNANCCGLWGKSITELNWSRVPLREANKPRAADITLYFKPNRRKHLTITDTLRAIWRLSHQLISFCCLW